MQNKLTKELAVCGVNAVAALGAEHPEIVNRLFIREDRFPLFTKVCKQLALRKRPYKICEDEELERITKSVHHQGVAAMILAPEIDNISKDDMDFWAEESKVGILLHSVGNDHNLGAIVRSAAFFGVHFIIISEKDSEARLTTSAYRVAEGGMEYVVFRKVLNTEGFLNAASKALVTIGAEPRARQRISDLEGIIQSKNKSSDAARPGILLIMGNEETGLPQSVKDQCSALVRIPGTGVIESLNVAQAATLFLYELFAAKRL